jgi:VWFA-related protein
MRSVSAVIATLLSLGASAVVRPQDVAPAATAEVVRLDVIVTDADGNPVAGLARGDFSVLEDGKIQRLTDFVSLAQPGTVPTSDAPVAAGEPAPRPGGASQPGRRIAIVVDELHLSRRSAEAAKGVLRRFLSESVAPEDEVALVVAGRSKAAIQPTRDRAVLQQAIERISARADSIVTGQGAQLTAEQAEQILRGDPSALKLGARLLRDEPGRGVSVRGGGSPRDTVTTSDPTPVDLQPEEKGATLEVESQARALLAEALSISAVSLATVEDVLRGMASLPGHKLCLLVSDGFLVGKGTSEERTQQLQQVVDAATRSGMAVYSVVASGLVSVDGDAAVVGNAGLPGLRDRVARASERLTIDTLQGLADDTGGLVLRGSEGIATGLARMLHDSDALYLLAYEPANKKRDGRFRRIDVRLPGHRDYVLRTRRGYFAADDSKRTAPDRRGAPDKRAALDVRATPEKHATPGMPAADPLALGIAAARRALALPPPQEGVPLRMAADFVELTPGRPEAVVKAHLDPAGLPWTKGEGRQRAEFDLIGGVFEASGQPGPLFAGKHYVLDVTPAELERLKETGVRFEANFPLKPGRYEIRMLALDSAHAPLGGVAGPIQIPDLTQQKLTLSGVFVSSSAASVGVGPGVEAGEALRDVQALRRFKASDSLYYKVYVYNAARDATGASDVVLQSQILSALRPPFASKPQQALLREKDGAPLPEADGIPLLGLVPGRYELRIVAADRKTNTVVSRSVDFTVVE